MATAIGLPMQMELPKGWFEFKTQSPDELTDEAILEKKRFEIRLDELSKEVEKIKNTPYIPPVKTKSYSPKNSYNRAGKKMYNSPRKEARWVVQEHQQYVNNMMMYEHMMHEQYMHEQYMNYLYYNQNQY